MQTLNPTEKLLFEACVRVRRHLELLAAFEENQEIGKGTRNEVRKLKSLCDEIKSRYLTI